MDLENYQSILAKVNSYDATLVAVSKTKPVEDIEALHQKGQVVFGENKIQEMCDKQSQLPDDIEWHMIGHIQRNKVKYMAPFVSLVHGVDRFKVLRELNKQAQKVERVQDCLLQMHIADEESKFGFDQKELEEMLADPSFAELQNVRIRGLMGMATFTDDEKQIRKEFKGLRQLYEQLQNGVFADKQGFSILSMGMSGDYAIALEEGSNMVRIGSLIFGERHYDK